LEILLRTLPPQRSARQENCLSACGANSKNQRSEAQLIFSRQWS
jgi:hypothetical protein